MERGDSRGGEGRGCEVGRDGRFDVLLGGGRAAASSCSEESAEGFGGGPMDTKLLDVQVSEGRGSEVKKDRGRDCVGDARGMMSGPSSGGGKKVANGESGGELGCEGIVEWRSCFLQLL